MISVHRKWINSSQTLHFYEATTRNVLGHASQQTSLAQIDYRQFVLISRKRSVKEIDSSSNSHDIRKYSLLVRIFKKKDLKKHFHDIFVSTFLVMARKISPN